MPVLNCAHELPLPALNSSSKLDASLIRGKTHSLESLVESLLFSNAVAQGSNARRSILVYAVLTQHAAQDPRDSILQYSGTSDKGPSEIETTFYKGQIVGPIVSLVWRFHCSFLNSASTRHQATHTHTSAGGTGAPFLSLPHQIDDLLGGVTPSTRHSAGGQSP